MVFFHEKEQVPVSFTQFSRSFNVAKFAWKTVRMTKVTTQASQMCPKLQRSLRFFRSFSQWRVISLFVQIQWKPRLSYNRRLIIWHQRPRHLCSSNETAESQNANWVIRIHVPLLLCSRNAKSVLVHHVEWASLFYRFFVLFSSCGLSEPSTVSAILFLSLSLSLTIFNSLSHPLSWTISGWICFCSARSLETLVFFLGWVPSCCFFP